MRRCAEVCWAPHLNTLHYTFPIPLPTSLPLTPSHFPTHPIHFPTLFYSHTSFLTHFHTPTHFPTPPPTPLPTAPFTSPYTPTHFPTHSMHSPTPLPTSSPQFGLCGKLPSDDVALINLTGLWKSPIKFFTTTGNLKSCFGVSNANFRCMKVWRSYHVAKLLWRSYHVAKLLATG